jgi:hypothetical protein
VVTILFFLFSFFAREVLGLDLFFVFAIDFGKFFRAEHWIRLQEDFGSDQSVGIMPDHLHYRDLPPACCFKTMLRFGGGQVFSKKNVRMCVCVDRKV